jgi:hypothetical protein
MTTTELTRPLWQLTVGEFLELQKSATQQPEQQQPPHEPGTPEYVYGISGLAKLLGCSPSTAASIKRSGIIDAAITQHQRTIIIHSATALNLLRKTHTNRRKANNLN